MKRDEVKCLPEIRIGLSRVQERCGGDGGNNEFFLATPRGLYA